MNQGDPLERTQLRGLGGENPEGSSQDEGELVSKNQKKDSSSVSPRILLQQAGRGSLQTTERERVRTGEGEEVKHGLS